MQIGYIGLGKMGLNMVKLLAEKKHDVLAYNRSPEPVAEAVLACARGAQSINEMVEKLSTPRLVWIMVPHTAVDLILDKLVPLLESGDTVIDGGNSPYKESMRRGKELGEKGIRFLDVGVSGGPEGARGGACVMIGGEHKVFEEYEQLFKDIAAPDAYKYLGRSGAGHFVKMVHNGIEYGMMESIAEGFHIMKKSDFDLSMIDVADIYQHQSVVTSRLVGWLKKGFEKYGEDLEEVSGSAGSLGEGAWTVKVAKELGVEASSMEHALDARKNSQENPGFDGKLIQTMRIMFGGPRESKMIE